MNEKKLLQAFGGINEKYILEADENSPRKINKRMIAILIAAALVLVCAVGAGAFYFGEGEVINGMKWRFYGFDSNSDTIALDGITSHEGRVTKNGFDELDVTFSGAVCDNDELYAILTFRKKDGSAFTQPEGFVWTAGLTEISYSGAARSLGKVKEIDPVSRASVGEDGSLSVSIPGTAVWQIDELDRDYIFGLVGLYCVPEDYWHTESGDFSKVYKSGFDAVVRYESDDRSGYKELEEKYFSEMERISAECFSGEAACEVRKSSLKADIPSVEFEYGGQPAKLEVSPIKITVSGSGDAVTADNVDKTIMVYYKDGSAELLHNGNYMFGGGLWYITYSGSRPIDAAKIDRIMFGNTEIHSDKLR